MKQPTGMASMAPGFLIWLPKTNCFSLSTNPATTSSTSFISISIHIPYPPLLHPHNFPSQFVKFSHQLLLLLWLVLASSKPFTPSHQHNTTQHHQQHQLCKKKKGKKRKKYKEKTYTYTQLDKLYPLARIINFC